MDFERGVIKITKTVYRDKNADGIWQLCVDTPKTKASDRVIPLPEYITYMLRQYHENAKTPYVVENKKGERMSIRSYQYIFEKLTERAEVRKLNFHSLRHTFATRAIECGMDIKTKAIAKITPYILLATVLGTSYSKNTTICYIIVILVEIVNYLSQISQFEHTNLFKITKPQIFQRLFCKNILIFLPPKAQ